MSRPFKVGDRVWDEERGFGTVTWKHNLKLNLYPIIVEFDVRNIHKFSYMKDGRYAIADTEQSLFHADEVKDGKVQK